MSKLYIVFPVFNEQDNILTLSENIGKLIALLPLEYHGLVTIVFVDDGSKDLTVPYIRKNFSKFDFHIIEHKGNQGPGAAFSSAFHWVFQCCQPEDWILTMEGDNTSSHELVNKMFVRTQEGYDVVLASPYMYGGTIINTSKFRKFLSFFSNLILRELLGLRGIITMSSFFRLYRVSSLQKLRHCWGEQFVQTRGFESVVEILMKLVMLDTSISEVPLILDTAKRKGKSKMRILKTSFNLLSLFCYKYHWKKCLLFNDKIIASKDTV